MRDAFMTDVTYWAENLKESSIRLEPMQNKMFSNIAEDLTIEEKMELRNELNFVRAYIHHLNQAIAREEESRNPLSKFKKLFKK